MLIRSISSGQTKATDQETASSLMMTASRSRDSGSSFFESSTSGMRVPGARMTAAADTGPASGLIPASSTPATSRTFARPQLGLEAQHLAQALTFGAVVASSSRDGLEDGAGRGASVVLELRCERGGERAALVDVTRPQGREVEARGRGGRGRRLRDHGSTRYPRGCAAWLGERSGDARQGGISSQNAGRCVRRCGPPELKRGRRRPWTHPSRSVNSFTCPTRSPSTSGPTSPAPGVTWASGGSKRRSRPSRMRTR